MKQEHWNPAIDRVRDDLWLFANVRRGRMSRQQAEERRNRSKPEIYPNHAVSSLLTMVPTLVATSIGAGWAPDHAEALNDPVQADPSKSSTTLWEGEV